jgi:hypothetical protein
MTQLYAGVGIAQLLSGVVSPVSVDYGYEIVGIWAPDKTRPPLHNTRLEIGSWFSTENAN